MPDDGLIEGPDGLKRCWWHGNDPEYRRYHDKEWGRPCNDDMRLYEKICLEGFQAGLSWLTILRKRENFRAAFAGFDFEKVARFNDKNIARLMQNTGIIRHRSKIDAAINNAQCTCKLVETYGSLASYFWRFEPRKRKTPKSRSDVPAQTEESQALSADLKKQGFKFVGPITMYAHMQAMGMVNDHLQGCCVREAVEQAQQDFKRPL